MDAETQILLYKKKVADHCVVFLIFLFVFGIMQAFNQHKPTTFSLEKKSSIINTI